jgi:ribosomal-protein-alanine N-acetyltransferase
MKDNDTMTDAAPIFDFSSFPVITTERLRLRQLNHADAEGMMDIYGPEEMMLYLSNPPVDTPEKAIELIDLFNGWYDQKECVNWGITLRDDDSLGHDRLIGMCGNHGWDKNDRKVDIGYHIIQPLWGKGYATEAARAVIAWSFKHFDLHRIQADCTEGNIASETVMLKCGFTFEGMWRESCWEHGRFVNIRQYGLLRREFDADSGAK